MAHPPRPFRHLAPLASALTLAVACTSEFRLDQVGFCTDEPKGAGCPSQIEGNAGRGGDGGVEGEAGAGSSGQGDGGGGTAGTPGCSDASCAARNGQGSMCFASVCTATREGCDKKLWLVHDDARRVPKEMTSLALQQTCFTQSLDDALGSVGEGGSVFVLRDSVDVRGVVNVPLEGVKLIGQASDGSKPVRLNFPSNVTNVAGPLITLRKGMLLKGFAVGGAADAPYAATAVHFQSGPATIEGPFEASNTSVAFDFTGTGSVTVNGSKDAPVLLQGNGQGVIAGPAAAVTLKADGADNGLRLDLASEGAGIFVLVPTSTDNAPVVLDGIALLNNLVDGGADKGRGAITIQERRNVEVKNSKFTDNRWAITFDGMTRSDTSAFDANVTITGNTFSAPANNGTTLCGDRLGATANVRWNPAGAPPNSLPSGPGCPTVPEVNNGCANGVDVGYNALDRKLAFSCSAQTLSGSVRAGGPH